MTELSENETVLGQEERVDLVQALRAIRNKVRWKPGKDITHLAKRQRMKHLSVSTSLADYEQIIYDIVSNGQSIVYIYEFNGTYYYAVRGFGGENEWLVIFGKDGILETSFPPENMDEYLERRGFVFLCSVAEVLKWTKEADN